MRKLQRVLGAKAYAEIGERLSSPEKRERYRIRRTAAKAAHVDAKAALEQRRQALLAADEQYQMLLTQYRETLAAYEDTRYHDDESGYKFHVGTREGIFKQPRAHGDTWEEVFAMLAEKAAP